ncbi:hypothetical protein ACWEJP_20910 [Streptomyces sp. NPDC004749]
MEIGGLAAAGVALIVGLLGWTQSRATNRRSDFAAITERLDRDLAAERVQRKLLTSFVLDLLRWARRVEPDTQAGPPPDPPADLDLTPWRR